MFILNEIELDKGIDIWLLHMSTKPEWRKLVKMSCNKAIICTDILGIKELCLVYTCVHEGKEHFFTPSMKNITWWTNEFEANRCFKKYLEKEKWYTYYGCKYCTESVKFGNDAFPELLEVREDKLTVFDGCKPNTLLINFCPMCGTELDEEYKFEDEEDEDYDN